jgi:hypothetical protein
MKYLPIALCAALLQACLGPFASTRHAGPLELHLEISSLTATADLVWEQAPSRQFLYYEIERATTGDFVAVAQITDPAQTTYADRSISGNTPYRYRVLAHYGKKEKGKEEKITRTLASSQARALFHRLDATWDLPTGFHPTRLAVDSRGTTHVVGAGQGKVARFDRQGQRLADLDFTTQQLACLETGTLDGPSLALDTADNLYVAYNLAVEGRTPQAMWSKFDPAGQLVWQQELEGIFARHIAINQADEIFIESISQLQQFDPQGRLLIQKPIPALLVSSLRFWDGLLAALVEPLHTEVGWQSPRLVVYNDENRSGYERVLGRDPLSPEDRGNGLLRRPSDFAVDAAHDRAFVVNAGADRVEVFRAGEYLTRWGDGGETAGAFRFSGMAQVVDDIQNGSLIQRRVAAGGVALDREGFVLVADTFNDRVQKFRQ